MVIFIVPYPCGTIFSIILILMGIFSLPADPQVGISMIILGIVLLVINQAITGSRRPGGIPIGNQRATFPTKSHSSGMGYDMSYFCPKCSIEYKWTNSSKLCPSSQVPLEIMTRPISSVEEQKKSFYFDNQ